MTDPPERETPARRPSAEIRAGLEEREATIAAREGELHAEWERLRYVLLAARIATWEYDIQADTATLSPSAAAYFGVPEDDAPRSFAELLRFVHPDDRERVSEAFALALAPEESDGPEFRVVWPDGAIHWIANKGRVWRDEAGVPRKMLGVLYSTDERKREEEQRLEFERRIQHHQKLESLALLAGGVAHDFNNLLVGVLGNATLIAMDLPENSPLREPVESIEKAARRASELVRQMLAYTGRAHRATESLDLNVLVREMEALLRAAISHRISFRFELAPVPPTVTADATQLRQVVMNLITNAADAIGSNAGTITIRTGETNVDASTSREHWVEGDLPDGAHAWIEVLDTGCGMDPSTMQRIFDPFFTTKFVGRGLGLAATRGIVRGHGGGILVTSEPGQGSTFRIAIPRGAAASARSSGAAPAVAPWTGHGTVLIIDDEAGVRQVLVALLRRSGFTVLAAADVRAAAELLRRHREDVVVALLDGSLPDAAGPEAVDALRSITPELPVVVMGGGESPGGVAEFHGRAIAGVLRKPFLAADLLSVLRRAMEDRERMDD